MNCSVCNRDIPSHAKFCPGCGTRVSFEAPQVAEPGLPEPEPVISMSPYEVVLPEEPATNYGAYVAPPLQNDGLNSYDVPSIQNYSSDPYTPPNSPPLLPPPIPGYVPPARKNNVKTWLIIGGCVLLVLLLLCGGSSYLFWQAVGVSVNQYRANATATAQAFNQDDTTPTPSDQSTVPDQDTPVAQPTIQDVVTPSANPPYEKGSLVLNDPLSDNSKGYKWDEATINSTTNSSDTSVCAFKGGSYHLSRTVRGGLVCDPEASQLTLSNLAIEAKLAVLSGDSAGIVVRFNQNTGKGYLLSVFTNGSYTIDFIDFNNPNTNQEYKILRSGTNAAIHQGLGQTNLVAFVANGHTLSAYINDQFIDTIDDSTLSSGQIGIYGSSNLGAMEISATNARAWQM